MPQVCATCSACEPIKATMPDGTERAAGECRANPPQMLRVDGNYISAFARVLPLQHWCRQWEPRFGFDERGERVEPTDAPKKIILNG